MDGPVEDTPIFTNIPKSWFHKPAFRKLMSLPCWGGSYSYVTVETDPAQEVECIRAFQVTAAMEKRPAILGPVLGLPPGQPLPATLDDAVAALMQIYPPGVDDCKSLERFIRETNKAALKHGWTHDEVSKKIEGQQKLFEWMRILKAVPTEVNELLAAWNRLECDEIYDEVSELAYISPVTLQYLNIKVNAIKKQEERWQQGVQMSFGETLLFWLWGVIMQLVVIVPDTISVFLGAVLAVFRSGPIRLQSQIIAFGIWDFPWADERLARFITFQRYLGILPTALFGLCAIFDPNYRRTAFRGLGNLAAKASISISWQMFMHNWKNFFDLYFSRRIGRMRLAISEVAEVRSKHDRLKRCNAYAYAWFETYNHSNRFGAQVSYHKQDHQDAVSTLNWAAGIKEEVIVGDDLKSKSVIWAAFIVIGCLICVSTFPTDPYAGLIAIAYFGPLIARAGMDLWDPSQSFDDLLRLFTTTAGPTFPSTMLLVVNVIYWGVTKKALFVGFRNARFVISFSILFVLSLYPKLWGECFKSGISWIQSRFATQMRFLIGRGDEPDGFRKVVHPDIPC